LVNEALSGGGRAEMRDVLRIGETGRFHGFRAHKEAFAREAAIPGIVSSFIN